MLEESIIVKEYFVQQESYTEIVRKTDFYQKK